MTLGNEQLGLRITKGRLDRRGNWHPHQPCIFVLFRGKRASSWLERLRG